MIARDEDHVEIGRHLQHPIILGERVVQVGDEEEAHGWRFGPGEWSPLIAQSGGIRLLLARRRDVPAMNAN